MAERLTRKDLKKDEFREGFVHGAEVVATHQTQAFLYGGVALFIVIVALSWHFYTQNQTAKASAAFANAMTTYEARIRTASDPAPPEELTYVDAKNKYGDAAKQFSTVADRYPRTRPGQMARYYVGLSDVQLGNFDEALKNFKIVQSSSDQDLVNLTRFQEAQVYDRTGQGDQAVQIYQQLVDRPTLLVPKPIVLLALADHFSTSNPGQAAQYYKQVKSEFPDSPAAQLADQRLQLLPVKS